MSSEISPSAISSLPQTQFPSSVSTNAHQKYSLISKRAHRVEFALNLAQQRENFRWSFGYTSLLTLATLGVGIFRGSIPFGMAVFCSTCWTGTIYLYDLSYGNMIHRVNKEAHKILVNQMEFEEEN